MYSAEWINLWQHDGAVDITLLLTDPKGLRPDVRIEKNYHQKSVDDGFLAAEAESEIAKEVERQDNADKVIASEAEQLRKLAEVIQQQAAAADAKAVEEKKKIEDRKAEEAGGAIDPGGAVDGAGGVGP